MATVSSRRDALKAGFGAMVGAALSGAIPLRRTSFAFGQDRPAARAFVTDDAGHRHASLDDVLGGGASASAMAIAVDAGKPLQSVLGFGAAFTEGACTVINQLAPADRDALLKELVSPDGSNFSIGRLCVGASDYSTTLYSYDEGDPDPSLARFSIDHDKADVLPVLRQVRSIRPDYFFFSSPWSPPGWMKYGESMKGGSIKPHYTGVYAQYIVRYLQAYQDAGVKIDAMTMQNEIDADQDGKMPACAWPEEVGAAYLVNDLGPAVAKAKLGTKIWLLDHNYNLFGRVLDELARPGVKDFADAIAWHGYAGSIDQIAAVHDRYPDLPMHWTEGGDMLDSDTLAKGWASWASKFATILNHGISSITTWNLALDETGHPNIGPFSCAGMITIDSKSKAITRNGIYWAMVHCAKAFGRGTRVLGISGASGSVTAVAGKRADGSIAVVISNEGAATSATIQVGGSAAPVAVNLAGNSVTTVLVG